MVLRFTESAGETKKVGEKLARKILREKPGNQAVILALSGELGSGKTTFLQGFARGLGIREKILSPTFILMRKFKIRLNSLPNSLKFANFYHFDCYRIKEPKEILNLGFQEIISNPLNIIAIEWADRVKKILPKNAILLQFEFVDEKTRKISVHKPKGTES